MTVKKDLFQTTRYDRGYRLASNGTNQPDVVRDDAGSMAIRGAFVDGVSGTSATALQTAVETVVSSVGTSFPDDDNLTLSSVNAIPLTDSSAMVRAQFTPRHESRWTGGLSHEFRDFVVSVTWTDPITSAGATSYVVQRREVPVGHLTHTDIVYSENSPDLKFESTPRINGQPCKVDILHDSGGTSYVFPAQTLRYDGVTFNESRAGTTRKWKVSHHFSYTHGIGTTSEYMGWFQYSYNLTNKIGWQDTTNVYGGTAGTVKLYESANFGTEFDFINSV